MEVFIYKKGDRRPAYKRLIRIILRINSLPIIRSIFKRIIFKYYNLPESTSIYKNFYCSSQNLFVGKNVGLADTFILAYAPVRIGDNCSFSYRNMIITSTHDIDDFSTIIAKSVNIGSNVWITTNVTILPGVSIGDNTVIGAGSVVTKDIPEGVFAAGNPCKVIRKIDFKK